MAFLNSTRYRDAYNLAPKQRQTVASGDFRPIAQKILSTVEETGAKSISVFGYSQGAAIGAVVLRCGNDRLSMLRAGLVEPPNVLWRTTRQLAGDFQSESSGLAAAVKDADMPELLRRRGEDGSKSRLQSCASFGRWVLDIMHPDNRALALGMRYDSFWGDLRHSDVAENSVSVAVASQSRVCPADVVQRKLDKYPLQYPIVPEGQPIIIPGGHSAGDNIVLHALLAAATVDRG